MTPLYRTVAPRSSLYPFVHRTADPNEPLSRVTSPAYTRRHGGEDRGGLDRVAGPRAAPGRRILSGDVSRAGARRRRPPARPLRRGARVLDRDLLPAARRSSLGAPSHQVRRDLALLRGRSAHAPADPLRRSARRTSARP